MNDQFIQKKCMKRKKHLLRTALPCWDYFDYSSALIAATIIGGILVSNMRMCLAVSSLQPESLSAVGSSILFAGLKAIGPNEALVLALFGNYYGTLKSEGFYWVNPFFVEV